MKVVRVEWLDASFQEGWDSLAEADRADGRVTLTNETVGYLLSELEDRIVIAQSVSSDGALVTERLRIPRPCVLKMEVLRDG